MSDFKAKMHQNRLRPGLRPRSDWACLERSPDPYKWNLLLRKEVVNKGERERKRKEREMRGREKEGWNEGRGREIRKRMGKGRLAIIIL